MSLSFRPSLPAAPNAVTGRWLLGGGLLYLLLFGWYCWPLAASFGTAFVGDAEGDANQYIWNAYNFQRQLAGGHNPFYTPLLLFPQGTGLWLHTYTPVLGLLNALLRHEIWAVNLGLLLSFGLSGVGAARLAGRWLRQPVLCLVVGYAFAFSPYKLAHWPAQYHLLLTATVPFCLAAFLNGLAFAPGRWPAVRRWQGVAGAAALLLLTLFSDYYTTAGLLWFGAGYTLWFRLRLGQVRWRRPRPWLVAAAGLALGHGASRLLARSGASDNAAVWWGGDLAGYLLPPLGNRWLASAATNAFWTSPRVPASGSIENVVFVGYALPLLALALLLLALPGLRRGGAAPARPQPPAPPETQPLAALVLLFWLLTMPELRWFGHDLLRLPTSLVHFVPFLNNIRCPTRYVLLFTLLFPLLTCLGLERYFGPDRPWLKWLGLALGLVLGVEYQPLAFPLVRTADVPRAYRLAGAEPGAALFPIPFGMLDGYRMQGDMYPSELFYQTRHHKAIPGAYISRLPASAFATLRADPVLHALLVAQQRPAAFDSLVLARPGPAQVAAFLGRYQPAAFVVRPAQRDAPVHRLLRLLLAPGGFREQVVDGYTLLRPTRQP